MAAKVDYVPLYTRVQDNVALQKETAQAHNVDRFRERSELKSQKFPASFIK